MEIYQPAEDSYLLSETLKQELKNINDKDKKELKILDLGTGSGIQAKTCKNLGFKDIICVDINKKAVLLLKQKGFKSIHTNLFSSLKNKRFDIIIFNPPYLPKSKYDKEKDTTGGKKGYETILKFLEQAKNHLTKKGKIFLLYSSLSKPNIIKKQTKQLGYNLKLLNQKNLFFEKLYVVELKLNTSNK